MRFSLAVSTATYLQTLRNHLIELFLPGFGDIAIYSSKVRRTELLALRIMQSSNNKTRSNFEYHHSIPRTPPRSNARRPPRNGQPRRPGHSPGFNTRFCLNLVSITFQTQEGVSWLEILRRVVEPLLLLSVIHRSPKEEAVGERWSSTL